MISASIKNTCGQALLHGLCEISWLDCPTMIRPTRGLLFLFLLLLSPGTATAAGIDITADEISREADGSVMATGRVIIKQYPVMQIHQIRISGADKPASARILLEYSIEPSADPARKRRKLLLNRSNGNWLIVMDRPAAGKERTAAALPEETQDQLRAFIESWRKAWNSRDLNAFLRHYQAGVFPDFEFASRDAWIEELKRQFSSPPERTLQADRIRYRIAEHLIEAEGHVRLESRQGRIEAESITMDSETRGGTMRHATLFLPSGERLAAERVTRINDTLFEAEHIRYTACPPDAESWAISARHARLDQDAGELVTRSTRFELNSIPVLYLPWMTQPLKRKSGFLSPGFATSRRRGTELSLPYYLAPAENWDATLTPTWMSKRGWMGGLEFRHVATTGTEEIRIEGLRDKSNDTTRSRIRGQIRHTLPAGIELEIEGDHVSDHDYLADFGRDTDINRRYLTASASLSQHLAYGDWSLAAIGQQDMQLSSNATVLQILPRFESHFAYPAGNLLRLHFDQQSTLFSRRTGFDGWRFVLNPYIEIPWQPDSGSVSTLVHIGSRHNLYRLQQLPAGDDPRPSLNAFEASLEIRSEFERISTAGTWRHALSPVLRYDYVLADEQSTLPNFDSAFGQLTWSNLLSGNRFAGYDRIERAHRVTLYVENRLQHKPGMDIVTREVLNLRLGASYNLDRNKTDVSLQTSRIRPFSNLLGGISWNPWQPLTLAADTQYDPYNHFLATTNASLDWRKSSYTLHGDYQRTDARYAAAVRLYTLSGSTRLSSRWSTHALWQYDNLRHLTQQTTIGLTYRHPCWILGIEGYRTNRPSDTSATADTGVRLLLEFKGLGSVGS